MEIDSSRLGYGSAQTFIERHEMERLDHVGQLDSLDTVYYTAQSAIGEARL
jgi:hypothetical protein